MTAYYFVDDMRGYSFCKLTGSFDMLLADLKVGQRARLISFGDTPSGYRRRLLSLGLTQGTDILLIRRAPLGCPVQVELRNTAITLRQDEANCLRWEVI